MFSPRGIQVQLSMPPSPAGVHWPATSVKLVVDPNDFRDVPFSSLREGDYENLITRLLLAFGAQSRIFLDVGSNIGFYCVTLAKAFPGLLAHAVEPNSSLWERWETNQVINKLEGRCTLHKAGLSVCDRETSLFVPELTGSGGGSLRVLHPEETQREIPISLQTPDSLGLPNYLDLVKIDTEGAELEVVTALKSRLKISQPTIIIELLRKWMAPFDSHPQDVVNILRDLDYAAFGIGTEAIVPLEEITDQTLETNFLFVHNGNKNHLATSTHFLKKNGVV
jgi:FkbM family methyltransferase